MQLYRIVKLKSWWTRIWDTAQPQFLYFDYDTEHFEVAGYQVAKRYKYYFTKSEIEQIQKDYPGLENEFFIEVVRARKTSKNRLDNLA